MDDVPCKWRPGSLLISETSLLPPRCVLCDIGSRYHHVELRWAIELGMLVVPEEGMSSLRDPSAGLLSSTFLLISATPFFPASLLFNKYCPSTQMRFGCSERARWNFRRTSSHVKHSHYRAHVRACQARVELDGTKQDLDRQHRVKP